MSITLSKLPNGLTIVTDPMPHLESASVGVWVNAGARNENAQEHGLSHLLEHMAFKGTATRSARDIAEQIERVGGYLNAYTAREQTAYYARTLKADVPLAMDLLADILLNSSFATDELERERGVVIQEIGQSEDTPDDIIFDHLQGTAFPDQPMGRPILGTVDSVSGFTADALRHYMGKHYRASEMTLIASGAIDHGTIAKAAEKLFAGVSHGPQQPTPPGQYAGGEYRGLDELEQTHLTLAWPGLALDHEDAYVAQIYITALGGGMSSRLFQEARERRGLCYAIYSFANSFKDCGMFGIYAGTGAAQANELIKVVAGEMQGMADKVQEDEVVRARAQMKAGLLMALESPTARCEQIASQLWSYGRILSREEVIGRLDAIDAAAVKSFAQRVAGAGPLSLAALGPVEQLASYSDIARHFG